MSINRNMSILAAGASSTGGLSNVASIGIGMTPSNVLDITQSANAESTISILNANAGTGVAAQIKVQNGSGYGRLGTTGTAFTTSGMYRQDGTFITATGAGGISLFTAAAQPIYFGINSVEVARFDTNNCFLVGTTTTKGWSNTAVFESIGGTGRSAISGFNNNNGNAGLFRVDSTGGQLINFYYTAATNCGSITTNGTNTAYNTSSDYRLKENVKPMTGGLATVAALKPVNYDWIIDKSAGEGFIAHELQAVIPDAVHGEKDAVNEDGSIKAQGVDFGKIVPHLVAAMQELTTRLAALEAK